MIRRSFIDLPHGQVHLRSAGRGGRPLVMFHTNPTSSVDLVPLIERLAGDRAVFAPDTPGLGDSAPLPLEAPHIADYADAMARTVDALGLETFDLYGSHTGANLAVEIALAMPDRAARLVIDGIAMYSDHMKADLMAHYAPEIEPDLDGRHLMWAWHFMRDQHLFWPWFRRTADRRRQNGLPSAETLHVQVLEVLKNIRTIRRAYHASFTYDKAPRLRALRTPTLLASSVVDLFYPEIDEAAALIPGVVRVDLPAYADPGYFDAAADTIRAFLDRGPDG